MKILVCGTCLPREFEVKIKDLSVAGNQYQNNLIKALNEYGQVKTISYIPIQINLDEEYILKRSKEQNIYPVFANKNKIKAFQNFRKKLKEEIEWADVIITYNVLYSWFGLPKICNKYNKKSVVIAADFTPSLESQGISRKIYSTLASKELSKYDKVVMLSQGINEYLSEEQEKVVINGCISWDKFDKIKKSMYFETINICYTGLLSKVTGVDILIEAFKRIDNENIRLIISGQGEELIEYINESARYDKRIIFKGFVSYDEYYEILDNSHILVNPRNMTYEQNKHNFPSKVLEYLCTGRIVISTKFSGYQKYKNNIKFVESDIYSMENEIINCLYNIEQSLNTCYEENRKFAKTHTWENQIIKFL